MNIKNLLQDEFKDEIEELGKMELGNEQYKVAVDGVTKLADRLIELEKIEIERLEKEADREVETDLKLEQMRDERKHRWAGHAITIGTFAAGMGFTYVMNNRSMRFEKEDSFASTAGREWNKKAVAFFKGLF